jgi:hypothetical protein
MTAQISFVCALINDSNFFVAALYDASNLSVCLESQQVPKTGGAYTTPFQVTFLTNLTQGKVYRCILWESADATPAGVSRVSGDFTASLNSVSMRGDLYLTGGGSSGMDVGASGYVDPTGSNAGWGYDLEQVGYGTLQLNVDYTVDPTTGDWTLINGTTIGDGQKFVEHFQPQISAATQPSVSAISSGQILTAGIAMTSALKNQALYIQGTGTNMFFTLPALSTLADYDRIVIRCNGGLQINAVFACNGTDKILYGQQLTQLILGQRENMILCKANGVFNVEDSALPGVDKVGEVFYKFTRNNPASPLAQDINTILLDGSLKSRSDYARLFAYMSTLETNSIVSETTWPITTTLDGISYYPNKSKWTMGTSSANFRVPLLIGSFIRNADGSTRFTGSLQPDAMLLHKHPETIGLLPGGPNGEGPLIAGGKYGNPFTTKTDMTDVPYTDSAPGVSGAVIQRVDIETRPINIALYASIRI